MQINFTQPGMNNEVGFWDSSHREYNICPYLVVKSGICILSHNKLASSKVCRPHRHIEEAGHFKLLLLSWSPEPDCCLMAFTSLFCWLLHQTKSKLFEFFIFTCLVATRLPLRSTFGPCLLLFGLSPTNYKSWQIVVAFLYVVCLFMSFSAFEHFFSPGHEPYLLSFWSLTFQTTFCLYF